ncbi:MAG: D-amino acid dehydrogenase [Pseudomonadota bacterium]
MNAPQNPDQFKSPVGAASKINHRAERKIAVIGAGITGVSVAYALVKRGFNVTVFDRNRYPAMDTSFANGGQLSASNAEVWNHPSSVRKGLKWLLKKDAPLLFNLTPSWHKYSWMAEFMLAMRGYEHNTVRSAEISVMARDNLLAWAQDENIDFDRVDRGILHVYHSKKATEHARYVGKLLASGGLERDEVSPDDVASIEPTLTQPLEGAFYTPSDMSGDIHKFTRGLANAAERHGVRFFQDVEVTKVWSGKGISISYRQNETTQTERFDQVVVAAGVGSYDIAKQLGDHVNVYPVKGYSVTVMLETEQAQAAAPWVALVDDDAKIVTSRLGKDRFRVAGTAEFNGFNRDIRADRIKPLIEWCNRLFPDMPTEHCVPWAGLRPMMPDMMPRLTPGRAAGVHYHCGHGHLGWTMSCGTAELIAENVAQEVLN